MSMPPPPIFVTHAGSTAPSPMSEIDTAMSGTTALIASAHARHVWNIRFLSIVIGSFISSAAKALGCAATASAISRQYRTKASRPAPSETMYVIVRCEISVKPSCCGFGPFIGAQQRLRML